MIQMLNFLPVAIKNALLQVNMRLVYELRLRADKPTTVNFDGRYLYLCEFGLSNNLKQSLRVSESDIEDIVYRAGKFSVYSVEEQIKRGFLTAEGGARIGLCGEYVYERGTPLTVKHITSLCIRIPHDIEGCADDIYDRCLQGQLKNLLIASPPGIGKTTILRDLAKRISRETLKNILICDERGEISASFTGDSCDVLRFADKATAFEAGIRAMRPDVMITDELSLGDLAAVKRAIGGGVVVIASAHLSDISFIDEPFRIFERYAVLDGEKIGRIKGVYDENLQELCQA